jgi:hypothetical protein
MLMRGQRSLWQNRRMLRFTGMAAWLMGCSFSPGENEVDAAGPADAEPDAEVDAPPACATPFIESMHGCHLVMSALADWAGARAMCQAVAADVPILDSAAETDHIEALANLSGMQRVWIGIDGRVSYTTWIDGTAITGANWLTGQPDIDECGAIRPDRRWVDRPCNASYSVVCEK